MAAGSGVVGAIRVRLRQRRRMVTAGLGLVLILVVAASLSLGDFPIAPEAIVRSLLSPITGEANRAADFIVLQVRLPRTILAIISGAAFAMAGIIFQTILRNPLASPDIIGISHGASAAAVAAIILFGWSGVPLSLAAFAGAVLTALAIYGLAWRNGVTAYRIVLIGIGMAAILVAVISYLFTRARIFEVQQAMGWLVGSLNAASTGDIVPLVLALLVLVPLTVVLARHLDALELGDDAARALGTRVEAVRLGLVIAAVGYAAFATAAVGPVGFVALVSGPVARLLLAGSGRGFAQAALVGALVMLGSDLVGQHALPAIQLPVGVVTGLFGALFLVFLLIRSNRAAQA